MEWTADVSAGDWVRARLEPESTRSGGALRATVPRGFQACARVFHPADRDRPVGEPWPGRPYARHAREWEAFQSRAPEIDVERVTWAQAAAAFGRTMHSLAQWHRIAVDPHRPEGEDGPRDAAGWRYGEPAVGTLDPDVLARVATIAAAHTTTPDDARVGLWDGHGGLVGGLGYGPSRVLLTSGDDGDPRHGAMLGNAVRDAFNDVFRKPTWQPGVLSDEVSRGARLHLSNRAHVLFHAGLKEFSDAGWTRRVPWAQDDDPWSPSPSLLWPIDRAWLLVTDVDLDSTVVAGSTELVRDLCADPGIEALPVAEDADLGWDGDEVNP